MRRQSRYHFHALHTYVKQPMCTHCPGYGKGKLFYQLRALRLTWAGILTSIWTNQLCRLLHTYQTSRSSVEVSMTITSLSQLCLFNTNYRSLKTGWLSVIWLSQYQMHVQTAYIFWMILLMISQCIGNTPFYESNFAWNREKGFCELTLD